MPTTAHVIEPCDYCDTWPWCVRNGCVAWCEESARRLANVEDAEAALADYNKNGGASLEDLKRELDL